MGGATIHIAKASYSQYLVRDPNPVTCMVMIAQSRPTPGYVVLTPNGTPLGRVDLPLHPDLLAVGTVLLRRTMPALDKQ